jgi:hypothetical protein
VAHQARGHVTDLIDEVGTPALGNRALHDGAGVVVMGAHGVVRARLVVGNNLVVQ